MNNSEKNITKFENNELQITFLILHTLLLSASTVIKQSAKLSKSVAMLFLIPRCHS